jgi:hypothetical protein
VSNATPPSTIISPAQRERLNSRGQRQVHTLALAAFSLSHGGSPT